MKRINHNDEAAGMALLHDFGYNYPEIAEMWGTCHGTVERHVKRWKTERRARRLKPQCSKRHDLDLAEVRDYVRTHPGCSVDDVSMECNFSRAAAKRLMGAVQ